MTRSRKQTLPLLLYFPGRYLINIEAVSTAKISNLRSIIPEDKIAFSHNGLILNELMTFDSYRLAANDTIVAIPDADDDKSCDDWIHLIKETNSFQDHLTELLDPGAAREAARLRDFEFLRIEQRPKFMRRSVAQFGKRNRPKGETECAKTFLSFDRTLEPCKDPLPQFWTEQV